MPSTSLYYDSEATMSRDYNDIHNGKSRHISLKYDYVRESTKKGIITIKYVKSTNNLVDLLTKALPKDLIESTTGGMGLKPLILDTNNGNLTLT